MNHAMADKALDIANNPLCDCSAKCRCADIFSCECAPNQPINEREVIRETEEREKERRIKRGHRL